MSTDYDVFKKQFHGLTGIDLTLYKEEQMKRRLNTLRIKRNMASFKSYYEKMLTSETLLEECLDRMTINVTEFYRNRPRWDILEEKFLPCLLSRNREIKVWSAACSTGEEPFTLSLVLAKKTVLTNVNILATDIDKRVLAMAEKGHFLERSLANFTPLEREQFFVKEGLFYRLDNKFKTPVTFKQHNLLTDSAEGQFDLIVCRNVLIYFTNEAKQLIYNKFSQALKPGGILFVGSTEQIFRPENYHLKSIDTFFYEKTVGRKGL